MTPASFFEHFGISENPFRGEEARQDPVLARLVAGPRAGLVEGEGGSGAYRTPRVAMHPEMERILGDLGQPSAAVVFGEKGAGKTAIRLQIARAVNEHNARNPDAKVLLLAYDDLNPVVDRLHNRLARPSRKGETSPAETLKSMRLVDHIDGMLCAAVPKLVDAVLVSGAVSREPGPDAPQLGPEPKKKLRAGADAVLRRDLLTLQMIYDRPEEAVIRTRVLRRALGVTRSWTEWLTSLMAVWGWALPLLVVLMMVLSSPDQAPAPTGPDAPTTTLGVFWDTITSPAKLLSYLGLSGWDNPRTVIWSSLFFLTVGLWIVFLGRRGWTDRFRLNRLAHRIHKHVRVNGRTEGSISDALRVLPARWRSSAGLPVNDSEDFRYKLLQRLRAVVGAFGYRSLLIVVDRADEPSLIAGEPDRMRSVVWPLLSNKFMQQEGVAVKLLLPIELRHMLFRESSAFFQQARMDKQNLVEQLSWTGAMLYDLCDARIAACRREGAPAGEAVSLADLFAEDVGRTMLIEALEQMRQPRDAFKLIYQCVIDHCAQALENAHQWRIPRHVLDTARKQQAERVRQLAMGIRPA